VTPLPLPCETPEDRAAAEALLAGRRPKRVAGLDAVLAWAAESAGVPDWLAEASLAATGGDRAETAALLLPDPSGPTPGVAEVMARLETCGGTGARAALLDLWSRLPAPGRLLVNRLASGTFRPRKALAPPEPTPGPQRRVRAVMTQALPASREVVLAMLMGNALVPVARLRLDLPEAPALFAWVRENVTERFGPVRTVPALQVFDLGFTGTRPNPRRKCGLDLTGTEIISWLGPTATPDSVTALVAAQDLEPGPPWPLDDSQPSEG